MPTTILRAKKWVESGKGTPFYKKGVFCVRLNQETKGSYKQEITVGIDPGSKREAYTVKSKSHTYCNILSNTISWIKNSLNSRKQHRHARRGRNAPCRKNKLNRKMGGIPPSTLGRWNLKLRINKFICNIFPITNYIVEDVKAKTKGKKKWDKIFSPLEVGKNWFYNELLKLGRLTLKAGWETKRLRDVLGLKKNKSKLADKFECHNIDSWVLANSIVGGHLQPDNKSILRIIPLQFHRRQLHVFQPAIYGVRKKYGGTRSLGLSRGSLIKHKKYGLALIGGSSNGRVSLHDKKDFKRISQETKVEDCKFLTHRSWISYV